MPFLPSRFSAIHSQIRVAKFAGRVALEHWRDAEGVLLLRLPFHVAEGRNGTLSRAAEHGALLFHRWRRATATIRTQARGVATRERQRLAGFFVAADVRRL